MILTAKKRLKLYTEMLHTYQTFEKEVGVLDPTRFGFCSFLKENHDISFHMYRSCEAGLKKRLPELYAQKPKEMYDKHYWFQMGKREERIKALKSAIKLVKQKIK